MVVREWLETLIIRKDHVLCTGCMGMEPIFVGEGTTAISFVTALELMAARHRGCKRKSPK